MPTMTKEEEFQIIQDSYAASDRGDKKEESRLIRKLPLPPHLALSMKEMLGPEETKNSGFDFSEVEAKYGKDWLAT